MTTYMRGAVAAAAVAFLGGCASSSDGTSAATMVCAPKTFSCNGFTPGFWSNKNGCELLGNDYTNLNDLLAAVGLAPVDTCGEVEAILKVDAVEMSAKLLAMWTAFALNQWNFWDDDCFGGPIDYEWKPELWLPGDATVACEVEVQGWFTDARVTFDELSALAESLYLSQAETARCEQETLKNFFDAVNNDAKVCLCDCPTGATGGMSGAFGY